MDVEKLPRSWAVSTNWLFIGVVKKKRPKELNLPWGKGPSTGGQAGCWVATASGWPSRESKPLSNQHPNPGPKWKHRVLTASPGFTTVVTHRPPSPTKGPALMGGNGLRTPLGIGGRGLTAGGKGEGPSFEWVVPTPGRQLQTSYRHYDTSCLNTSTLVPKE